MPSVITSILASFELNAVISVFVASSYLNTKTLTSGFASFIRLPRKANAPAEYGALTVLMILLRISTDFEVLSCFIS